jgi:hypothetical protein
LKNANKYCFDFLVFCQAANDHLACIDGCFDLDGFDCNYLIADNRLDKSYS